jgi:hypothetical protein
MGVNGTNGTNGADGANGAIGGDGKGGSSDGESKEDGMGYSTGRSLGKQKSVDALNAPKHGLNGGKGGKGVQGVQGGGGRGGRGGVKEGTEGGDLLRAARAGIRTQRVVVGEHFGEQVLSSLHATHGGTYIRQETAVAAGAIDDPLCELYYVSLADFQAAIAHVQVSVDVVEVKCVLEYVDLLIGIKKWRIQSLKQ